MPSGSTSATVASAISSRIAPPPSFAKKDLSARLVSYLHLNPLRAGAVSDMEELDRHPWSGHAVIMGYREPRGQQIDEILSLFGPTKTTARQVYRQFVVDGIGLRRRRKLTGGGFRRSRTKQGMIEPCDGPIPGSGEFPGGGF